MSTLQKLASILLIACLGITGLLFGDQNLTHDEDSREFLAECKVVGNKIYIQAS